MAGRTVRFDIEARFKGFDDRITTVENALVSLDKKFDASYHETSAVLRDIQKSLSITQAKQGPGMMNILLGAGGIATLLAAVSTAITMLVSSQVSPSISQLQTNVSQLAKAGDANQQMTLDEYRDLKREKDHTTQKIMEDLNERLRTLETDHAWAPTVKMSHR